MLIQMVPYEAWMMSSTCDTFGACLRASGGSREASAKLYYHEEPSTTTKNWAAVRTISQEKYQEN